MPAGPVPDEPYATVHLWYCAGQTEYGVFVDILRRVDLHGCLPVMRVLAMPECARNKTLDMNRVADLLCRELDHQLAEQPATT